MHLCAMFNREDLLRRRYLEKAAEPFTTFPRDHKICEFSCPTVPMIIALIRVPYYGEGCVEQKAATPDGDVTVSFAKFTVSLSQSQQ